MAIYEIYEIYENVKKEFENMKKFKEWLVLVLKGACVGIADAIPGVSGGKPSHSYLKYMTACLTLLTLI